MTKLTIHLIVALATTTDESRQREYACVCVLQALHCIIYTDCQFYSGDFFKCACVREVRLGTSLCPFCVSMFKNTRLRYGASYAVLGRHRWNFDDVTSSPRLRCARVIFLSLSPSFVRSLVGSFVRRVFFLRSASAVSRSTLGSAFDAQCYTYAPGGWVFGRWRQFPLCSPDRSHPTHHQLSSHCVVLCCAGGLFSSLWLFSSLLFFSLLSFLSFFLFSSLLFSSLRAWNEKSLHHVLLWAEPAGGRI